MHTISKSVIAILLALSILAGACSPATAPTLAPTPAPTSQPGLALINATLIDGTGAEPIPDAVVLIIAGKITAAGPRSQVEVPAGAEVIDLGGTFILPGFINAHVHDAFDGERLKAWAAQGVTTVRDEGYHYAASTLRDGLNKRDTQWSDPSYARLVSAGSMIAPPAGYGQLYVTGASEARQAVLDEVAAGTDQIKFSVESGYASAHNLPLLSSESIAEIVATAHAQGRRVSAHITMAAYMQTVVDAGVDDVAHMPYDYIPPSLIEQMVAENIYIVPTLTVLEAYGALRGTLQNLRKFVEAGGQIALGNDYTLVPQNGFDHFDLGMPMHEITRMSEAGVTPMQIIVAATHNAAIVCGIEDTLGTVQPGKAADLLVVSGSPLDDLNNLTLVKLVIHAGQVIVRNP